MNLLLKLYGISYPIVSAILQCCAGSSQETENVDSFIHHDALPWWHDLLLAIPCCSVQRMEASPAPCP